MMIYSYLVKILVVKLHNFANEMDILCVGLDKINLDDVNNFDENDPEIIIHLRFLALSNKFEKRKALKKDINIELTPVAWYPTIWWDWCK